MRAYLGPTAAPAMNPTPSIQTNLRALSKLTDVTRSMGVEYGLELLLWLTYEHWRALNMPLGGRDYLANELLAAPLGEGDEVSMIFVSVDIWPAVGAEPGKPRTA